jgi:hypothetical protein
MTSRKTGVLSDKQIDQAVAYVVNDWEYAESDTAAERWMMENYRVSPNQAKILIDRRVEFMMVPPEEMTIEAMRQRARGMLGA